MQLEFRKPGFGDTQEITNFKKEFQDNNSGMDGTGILCRSSAAEWLESIRKMEKRDDPKVFPVCNMACSTKAMVACWG